jgi:hypothetical protein
MRGKIIRNRMKGPLCPPMSGRIPLWPALGGRLFELRGGLSPLCLTLNPKRLYTLPLSSILSNNSSRNAPWRYPIIGTVMPSHFANLSLSPLFEVLFTGWNNFQNPQCFNYSLKQSLFMSRSRGTFISIDRNSTPML